MPSPSTHQDSPIERFNVGPDPEHPGFSEMCPADHGHWVPFPDHRSVVEELASAGADAWGEIEEALNSFGEGVLDEDGLLVRLRAAQSSLLPCTRAQSSLKGDADV